MENDLEKRLSSYLKKTIRGHAKEKRNYYNKRVKEKELNERNVNKISFKKYLDNYNNDFQNIDVNYNCPENAFTNPKYYKAMKKVPLKEKQVLYLTAVEELTIKEVSDILKTSESNVKKLKRKAIEHFKENLEGLNE